MEPCIGDTIAGIDKDAECYRKGECGDLGCEKCQIKCDPPCENCPKDETLRKPEVSDFVVVYQKYCGLTFKHKWDPVMDNGVGRIAYVASGNPVDGFMLKFPSMSGDILEKFKWPAECMRLANTQDVKLDRAIKTIKDNDQDANSITKL